MLDAWRGRQLVVTMVGILNHRPLLLVDGRKAWRMQDILHPAFLLLRSSKSSMVANIANHSTFAQINVSTILLKLQGSAKVAQQLGNLFNEMVCNVLTHTQA